MIYNFTSVTKNSACFLRFMRLTDSRVRVLCDKFCKGDH